jgi:hypothetical protein
VHLLVVVLAVVVSLDVVILVGGGVKLFSVTEILAIENHKLNDTFLHVTFGSQSLLKPTSDQIGYDIN